VTSSNSASVPSGPAGWFDRLHVPLLALLLIAAAALRVWRAGRGDTYYDGFGYVLIARSMVAGHLGTPYICREIGLHFDPLYPLLIAGIQLICGDFFRASRAVNVAAGVLLALPVYGFGRELYGRRPALYAAALALFHPFLVQLSTNAYSEPVYLLFGMLGLWWLWRTWRRPRWRWPLLAATALALAAMTRTQAVSVAGAGFAALAAVGLAFRGRGAAGFGRRLGAAAGLWLVVMMAYGGLILGGVGGRGESGKVWQEAMKKTARFDDREWARQERTLNEAGDRLQWLDRAAGPEWLRSHPIEYGGSVLRDLRTLLGWLLSARYLSPLIVVLILIQGLGAWNRGPEARGRAEYLALIAAAVVASVALLAVAIDRYLAMVLPLLLLPAGAGLDAAGRMAAAGAARERAPAWVVGLLPFLLLAGAAGLQPEPRLQARMAEPGPPDASDRAVAAWVAARIEGPGPKVIMAAKPAAAALTGNVFYLLPLDTPARVAAYARAQGADYVLFDGYHLNFMSAELSRVWISSLGGAGLARYGLDPVGHGDFPQGEDLAALSRVYLLKVVKPEASAPAGAGSD
jgi:4-amino-4-deoxy-L-arabinose transferase-like glycosyltransferase